MADFTAENNSEPILRFFEYGHLPEHLQQVSKPFRDLAQHLMQFPGNAERSVALRKLLEAKDAAVRAMLPNPDTVGSSVWVHVNALSMAVAAGMPLWYRVIVELAGMRGTPTMIVKPKGRAGRDLRDGQFVIPEAGMIIDVVHTDNA